MNWTTFAMCQTVAVVMQHVTVARGTSAREESALAIVPHMAYAAVVGLITPEAFTWLAVAIFAGPYLMNLPLFIYQRKRVRDVLRAALAWRPDETAPGQYGYQWPSGEAGVGDGAEQYPGFSGWDPGNSAAADVEPDRLEPDDFGNSAGRP